MSTTPHAPDADDWTTWPDEPPPPRRASTGTRVAAGLGGLVLVLLAVLFTGGLALAAFLGMGVAALIQRQRRRPYTPVAGWLGAASGAVLGFLAVAAVGLRTLPPGAMDEIQRQAAVQAERPTPGTKVDSVLERMYPGTKQVGDAQSRAIGVSLARSKTLLGAVLLLTVLTGGGMIGTVAWGSATVALYGALGRWPAGGRRRAPPGCAAAVARPAPARDAFDEIR